MSVRLGSKHNLFKCNHHYSDGITESFRPSLRRYVEALANMASRESYLEGLYGDLDPPKLDQPCKDEHLIVIADSICRWEELAPYLELTDVEVEDLKESTSSPKLRRHAMLKMWKRKKGKMATYRKLTETFASQGRRDVAEKVCEMCSSYDDHECVQTGFKYGQADIAEYGDHLRDVYITSEMRYSLNMDFLPSPTHTVFNLVLISSKKIEYGTTVTKVLELVLKSEVEEIIDKKNEVQLEDIFKPECLVRNPIHKFILFEGAPGAGKSTLACLICQRWGAKELFQEFQLVILIQLNDPEVHSAKSLADVLPFKSDFDAHKILSTLKSIRGQGVLFILDGWDEYAPQEKENSLLEKLICSLSLLSLPLSAVIVTS